MTVRLIPPGQPIVVGGRHRGVELLAPASGLTFLLRDDFTTAASAPLTSPRTAEPGPGTLTITDTGNKLTVATGKLTSAGGTGQEDPRVVGVVAQIRSPGRTLLAKVKLATSDGHTITLSSTSGGTTNDITAYFSGTSLNLYDNTVSLGTVATIVASVEYSISLILRATGAFIFLKGGSFTSWTLLWVSIASVATPLYPSWRYIAGSGTFTVDNFRVLDLPAPFNNDYGLANQRLSGVRALNDTFAHEANCVFEYTVTTLPPVANSFMNFRMADASNGWRVEINAAGDIILKEVVATVATTKANVTTVLVSGHRIVVVADGTTIRIYSNNVLRLTYSSASSSATATAGNISLLNSAVISDIVSFPRTLSGAAATYLDLSAA